MRARSSSPYARRHCFRFRPGAFADLAQAEVGAMIALDAGRVRDVGAREYRTRELQSLVTNVGHSATTAVMGLVRLGPLMDTEYIRTVAAAHVDWFVQAEDRGFRMYGTFLAFHFEPELLNLCLNRIYTRSARLSRSCGEMCP
jgi:hypothetical protein